MIRKMSKDLEQILKKLKDKTKVGTSVKEIFQESLKLCKEYNYNFAFPCNISINNIAAHDSAYENYILDENDMVKIDFGIEKDGIILDSAITIDLSGERYEYIELALKCLEIAKECIFSNKTIYEYQKEIQNFLKDKKLKIIENLCGHQIDKYNLHGISIPNVPYKEYKNIKFPKMFAIEPFICDGRGIVYEDRFGGILQIVKPKLKVFQRKYQELINKYPVGYTHYSLIHDWKNLVSFNILKEIPILIEPTSKYVSQAETTFYYDKEREEYNFTVDVWKIMM
jgi:methionyl aminopeptidase